jgi:hypothetical protein
MYCTLSSSSLKSSPSFTKPGRDNRLFLAPISHFVLCPSFDMASRPLNDDEVLSEMNKMVHIGLVFLHQCNEIVFRDVL